MACPSRTTRTDEDQEQSLLGSVVGAWHLGPPFSPVVTHHPNARRPMKDTPGCSRCRPVELSDADIIYDWNTVDERGRQFEQEILLLDETLRDGLQSPSITEPGIGDKIAIVHLL